MSSLASPARVRSEQRDAWQKEWPFTVELLPLGWLFADDRYQRPPIEPFIESRVQHFDPTLVGTIDVAMRTPESFAILDGQQRVEIVKRVDKRAIWAAVYRDFTLKDEAEFFFSKNRERRNMHPYYALRARMVAGEQGPKQIFKIADDLGFKLASGKLAGDPKRIVAISALEEVHAMTSLSRPHGSLQPALATIKDAFEGRDGAFEGSIIRGFGRFYQAFWDDEITYKPLVEELQNIGPKKLAGMAADSAAVSKHPKAFHIANEIINIHNRGLRRDRKLSMQMLHPGTRASAQAKRQQS